MKKSILLFFLIILSNFILIAQVKKNIDCQSLVWTRYYNQLDLNSRWSIHSEFDNRIFINPMVQNLFVVRVQGRYKIFEQAEFGAGFAYFSLVTQEPEDVSEFNKPEYRGQQDLTVKQTWREINFNQRYQIEERFFQNFDSQGLKSGTTFTMRFRYKLQVDRIFWKDKKHFLKAVISDEIMINVGNKIIENTFDQNRIYGGLQFGVNSNLALEMGYLNSFQQRSTGVDYFNRNIIRLSIYHKLSI
jgi:hypothetical protein